MNTLSLKNKKFTYKEYLLIEDTKQYEILRGNLISYPTPTSYHQWYRKNISMILNGFVRNNQIGYIFSAPTDVILDEENVVQPDLIFIKQENRDKIQKRGIFGNPDIVIEIVSQSTLTRDTFEKRDIYEKFGITEFWLVYPEMECVQVFAIENNKYHIFSEGAVESYDNKILPNSAKSKVLEGLTVKLEKIFIKI